MLANQNMQIEAMQATHRHVESVLALLAKACGNLGAADVATECAQLRRVLQDTDSMFQTLRDSSTADLSSVLNDVKKYSSDVIASESRELQATLKKHSSTAEADINERFKKLESRVLSDLASGGGEPGDSSGASRSPGKAGDSQVLKKVTSRMNDFESQVASQLQVMAQDIEKKMAFLASAPRSPRGGGGEGAKSAALETYASDLDAIKYDIGELKDLLGGAKGDTAHVKRIVLACERDMEDFTAAMDAVNVDLDEMRARVDSTHSIITSRQRVEATVTAEISTMRLDMGDMQEALKAHDAWMEDVSQSLQEAHERCGSLSEDIGEQRAQTQAKLDAKTDITSWNDTNDDVDASIKTVRDMASALRLEVDSRRRKVDDSLGQMRGELQQLSGRVEGHKDEQRKFLDDAHSQIYAKIEERAEHCRALEEITGRHMEVHRQLTSKMDSNQAACQAALSKLEGDLGRQDEEMSKEVNDRVDALERHHANVAKESAKRLGALDLRISGLQGASGESKRDVGRLREEVNSLTVKSAAHDMDIGKSCDDLRKLERHRAEDSQRAKQDVDAVYEELDQKVYEKSFQSLEDNVTKLTRDLVNAAS
jgi:chromosome segregation ATPase